MKPEKIIEVSDVELSTATVMLKTVRVGKSKMTLAVFRQLPVDNKLPDKGDCWGIVRYIYNDQGPWILFVADGILKKYQRSACPWRWVKVDGYEERKEIWINEFTKKGYYSTKMNPQEVQEATERRRRLAEKYEREFLLFHNLPQLYIAV